MNEKLLVIGLDGATFRLLDPLMESGHLPNIQKLVENGVKRSLISTFPPVTGPAWTSLATGKNPGRTGVFDNLRLNSHIIRKARPYWDYLSSNGFKVGVVNYPFLYPAYKLNGVMVSGFGSNPDENICYPEEFKQKLYEKFGEYWIHLPLDGKEYDRNPRVLIEHIFRLLEINDKSLQLLSETDLDILTFVISASDFAQHAMWRFIDPSHPYYNEAIARDYCPEFIKIWKRIDQIVGSVIRVLPASTNTILVSDHGFGPHRSSFYTNSWLEEEGYLSRRKGIAKVHGFQSVARRYLKRAFPSLYQKISRAAGSGKIPKLTDTDELDLTRTTAYSPINASLTGGICINPRILSVTSDSPEFEHLTKEISQKLRERFEKSGLEVNIFGPHDLYSGRYVNLAPDILFEVESGECEIHHGFGVPSFCQPPSHTDRSGAHNKEGIFIACGPDIVSECCVKDASIYDVAPTILHMFGMSIPNDMDGRVLSEIFRPGSNLAREEVVYADSVNERKRIRSMVKDLKVSHRQRRI